MPANTGDTGRIKLDDSQLSVVETIRDWRDSGVGGVFSVGGLAGTGKTTLASQLAELLECEVAYAAPTHKAVGVLRRKLPEFTPVRTVASMVYYADEFSRCSISNQEARRIECKIHSIGTCFCEKFRCPERAVGRHQSMVCQVHDEVRFLLREELPESGDILVLDEASMLSEKTIQDAATLGVPVLLIGDHGQLPPVKAEMNRWMKSPSAVLGINHRQNEISGIVPLALSIRETGTSPSLGRYGDGSVAVVSSADMAATSCIDPSRLVPGPHNAIITWTNRSRTAANRVIHHALFSSSGPSAGDRIIFLQSKPALHVWPLTREAAQWRAEAFEVAFDDAVLTRQNLWFAGAPMPSSKLSLPPQLPGEMPSRRMMRAARTDNVWQLRVLHIANGVQGTISDVLLIKPRCVSLVIQLDEDHQGISPGPFVAVNASVDQFSSDSRLRRDQVDPDGVWLVDYAYAITCHKAQGSEYDKVVVFDERPLDYERWMYTAVTRAASKLIVIRVK